MDQKQDRPHLEEQCEQGFHLVVVDQRIDQQQRLVVVIENVPLVELHYQRVLKWFLFLPFSS